MTRALGERTGIRGQRGFWLRCFLSAGFLGLLACNGGADAYAASCPALPDLSLGRLQGTVYGPSGSPVPQVLVRVEHEGKLVIQRMTDVNGRFDFKTVPGDFGVHVQFLESKSMDLNVRVGHGRGGFFHAARLRVILGLSGTGCNYATTNNKQFKNAIKRYRQRLIEVPPGP